MNETIAIIHSPINGTAKVWQIMQFSDGSVSLTVGAGGEQPSMLDAWNKVQREIKCLRREQNCRKLNEDPVATPKDNYTCPECKSTNTWTSVETDFCKLTCRSCGGVFERANRPPEPKFPFPRD